MRTVVEKVHHFINQYNQIKDDAIFIYLPDTNLLLQNATQLDISASHLPLYGTIFAVKDNIDVEGMPTSAACPEYIYRPKKNAPVVQKLLDVGALCIGKTNMDQFATGLVGVRSPYGIPKNVYNPNIIPGGSSSGSAVAVAHGLVDFALGTDTAGSGRVPASLNGIIGLKPTKGWLSTEGVVPAVKSLDCVSIFSKNIDLTLLIADIAGGQNNPNQSYSIPHKILPTSIGVLSEVDQRNLLAPEYTLLYQAFLEQLKILSYTLIPIDFSILQETAQLLYNGPWVAERYHAVGSFLETFPKHADPTVSKIILGGKYWTALQVHEANDILIENQCEIHKLFEQVGSITLPTIPHPYTIGQVKENPIATNSKLGTFTNFANLLNMCAISFPTDKTDHMQIPFGITLFGPKCTDYQISMIAKHYTEYLKFNSNPPIHTSLSFVPKEYTPLFVVGAHLTGLFLNHQLTEKGGLFLEEIHTSNQYKLFALPGNQKPGLMRVEREGRKVLGELWAIPTSNLGQLLQEIPQPLGLGKILLEDSREVVGFIAESIGLSKATDISEYGNWKAYLLKN